LPSPPGSPPPGRSSELETLELEDLRARLLECLADRLGAVVDPFLVAEDCLREEALVQHAVHDLLTCLHGLRLDLVRVRVDLALGGDRPLGDVLAADPLRLRGSGDVHRYLPRKIGTAAAELH